MGLGSLSNSITHKAMYHVTWNIGTGLEGSEICMTVLLLMVKRVLSHVPLIFVVIHGNCQ
jgi:hypothetical protein